MSGLASVRTSNQSADQGLHAADGDDMAHISVDDLLDHTWHYQCVVSPTFSTAALAAALHIPSTCANSSHQWITAQTISSKMSSPSTSSISDQHPILRKLNLKILDIAADERRGESLQSPDLLRLQRERIAASIVSSTCSHDEDGYVSLASLIINSPGASSETTVTSPTSESPHGVAFDLLNFLKKQSKSRRASVTFTRTCRDTVRRSSTSRRAVADPIRMNALYAGCLAVD